MNTDQKEIQLSLIAEYIFRGRFYNQPDVISYVQQKEDSLAVESIEQWILQDGSEYLKKLYPNFYYFKQFIKEFFNNFLMNGWIILELYRVDEILEPDLETLNKFYKIKAECEITPFCFGTPKIYAQVFKQYYGYQLDDKIIFARMIL